MRFSLKWILAGMAYCAVAAAAFSQQTWVYADILWAVTLVAFALALLVACFARGPRQVAAAGFVVFAGCYLLCVHFSAQSVPIERLLVAAGVGASDGNINLPATAITGVQRRSVRRVDATTGRILTTEYVVPIQPSPAPIPTPVYANPQAPVAPVAYAPVVFSGPADISTYIRAGNAVATMTFGLLGILLGSLALRPAKRPAVTS